MPRRLTVSIHPDGTIDAEASGTPGPDCLSAIEQLRQLLGAEVSDSRPTPEFAGSAVTATMKFEDTVQMEDRA